jgi:homocysteine S-methyltransferase
MNANGVNVMDTITQRLKAGKRVLIDGGMGTEVERRGATMDAGAWSAGSVLSHPDEHLSAHLDFIKAGAEVITANTFSATYDALIAAGKAEYFEAINRKAVEIALEARKLSGNESVAVAGSISTVTFNPEKSKPEIERRYFQQQVDIQVKAGVDLLILEMMHDVRRTQLAYEACRAAGLPVWIGFSPRLKDGELTAGYRGDSLESAILGLDADDGETVLAVMHTLTEETGPALRRFRELWNGPLGAYSHSGIFERPHWHFIDVITPDDYADACADWLDLGVQVIGGCCGIGPEHIQALKTRFFDQ